MKWLLIVPIILVAFIVGASIYLQPNDFIGCNEQPFPGAERCEKADAIVVVSGGDTNARTDAGINLYQQGWANVIIFSGAAKDKTGLSNAAAMRQRALAAGISPNYIYMDEFSNTTEENAQNTQSIFELYGIKKVILVTSGYHQRRASLEFKKRAGDIAILNHPLESDKDWTYGLWWLTPRGWWLTGGELAKITAFYVNGDVR